MRRVLTAAVRDHAERLFDYHDVTGPQAAADAIVGLGSYQPAVADHCAALYRAGVAAHILFTGGFGNWTDGVLDRPEALIFRDRALAAGVPESAILVEPEARNLGENATLSRRLLEAANLPAIRLAVVTKRNTTRRALLTFGRIWASITLHGPALHWSEQAVAPRTAADIVDEMIGDLQRILVYPTLGHQLPDTVPADVLDSYSELAEAGFDRHLLAGHRILPSETPETTNP